MQIQTIDKNLSTLAKVLQEDNIKGMDIQNPLILRKVLPAALLTFSKTNVE